MGLFSESICLPLCHRRWDGRQTMNSPCGTTYVLVRTVAKGSHTQIASPTVPYTWQNCKLRYTFHSDKQWYEIVCHLTQVRHRYLLVAILHILTHTVLRWRHTFAQLPSVHTRYFVQLISRHIRYSLFTVFVLMRHNVNYNVSRKVFLFNFYYIIYRHWNLTPLAQAYYIVFWSG